MTKYNKAMLEVCKSIAPLWPLKNYVAVNPYMGYTESSFDDTAAMLASRSSIRMTMPLDFYLSHFEKGAINLTHIEKALVYKRQYGSAEEFIKVAKNAANTLQAEPRYKTLVDLVDPSGELNQIMLDTISSWAAAYFDNFQAIWKGRKEGVLENWLGEAKVDQTPRLAGLKNFHKIVRELPQNQDEMLAIVFDALSLQERELVPYLHTLLLKIPGWASYSSGLDWNNQLYGAPSTIQKEFLSILLVWEFACYEKLKNEGNERAWKEQKNTFEANESFANEMLQIALILQDAFDFAHQIELIDKINTNENGNIELQKQRIQAVFCIDVRCEIIRRHIEAHSTNIETLGFAGFFGFPIKYKSTVLDEAKNQCPVLIPAGPEVLNSTANKQIEEQRKLEKDQFSRVWKNFKSGAGSAFSFVSPLGILYLPTLIKDSFHLSPRTEHNKSSVAPVLDLSRISLESKVEMAANFLTLVGLKDRLSELVLIVGHGSTSTNNPHAAGLDCGACGGNSGKENALTAAQILNDPEVRAELQLKGVTVPENSLFVAGLHDTTSDIIQLYAPSSILPQHQQLIKEARECFQSASIAARTEKAKRFNEPGEELHGKIEARGKDWSQVRPEWGLAGCSSFIIGNRAISKGTSFNGRTFLHNYDHHCDDELKILETIMTAPMVVTSWINLQYYASATDNKNFGAGNKTLHNVTGGFGVIEGSGGDLKTGLALQSISDGEELQHLPNRLSVFIQAPIEKINNVLKKHPQIQQLFDNNWIALFNVNDNRKVQCKYIMQRQWEELAETHPKTSGEPVFEYQSM